MRYNRRRRDPGEKAIVEALRKLGCSVTLLDGKGVPDLAVGYAGRNWFLEVKDLVGPRGGTRHSKGQHLTPDQETWWCTWQGQAAVVRTPEEAIEVVFGGALEHVPNGVS